MQSEQINELTAALAKAHATMENATLNKVNFFKSKYADLAAIFDAVRKPLAAQGLIITQTTEIREDGFVLVTTLAHTSGQFIKSEYPLPAGGKPHEVGSAITYARRYSLSAIAGIAADEDDDAEAAQAGGQKIEVRNAAPRQIKAAPPIEPPIDPETGEVSPHTITAADEMAWGGLFVAAVNVAKSPDEIEEWLANNDAGLSTLEGAAPKIYDRVMKRVEEKKKSFNKKEAA